MATLYKAEREKREPTLGERSGDPPKKEGGKTKKRSPRHKGRSNLGGALCFDQVGVLGLGLGRVLRRVLGACRLNVCFIFFANHRAHAYTNMSCQLAITAATPLVTRLT